MDPYLESDHGWMGFNLGMAVAFVELLNRTLRPEYFADSDTRFYQPEDDDPVHGYDPNLFGRRPPPPAAPPQIDRTAVTKPVVIRVGDPTREHRVEVRRTKPRERLTVIEFRSPANKTRGTAGRASFESQREEAFAAGVNWVEIDLLRTRDGHPSRRRFPHHQYAIVSSPVELRPAVNVWPVRITDPLPVVGIPLGPGEPEAALDIQHAFDLVYDRSAYEVTAEYAAEPSPTLPAELAKWAEALLRKKKLR